MRPSYILPLFGTALLAAGAASPVVERAPDTPKECVARFVAAIEAEDVAAVAEEMSLNGDTPDSQLRFAMAEAEVANGRLWKAARVRFGDGPALTLARHTGNALPHHRAYLECEWAVDGDRAVGRLKPGDPSHLPPIWLTRIGGQWKYAFPGEARPQFLPHTLNLIQRQTAAVEMLADQVKAGRYRTADEAERAFDELAGRDFAGVGPKVHPPPVDAPAAASQPIQSVPAQNGVPAMTPDQRRAVENPKTPMETAFAVGFALNQKVTAERLSRFFWSKDDADGKLAHAIAERVLASLRVNEAFAKRFPGEDALPARELGLVAPGDFFTLALGTWAEAADRAQFVPEPGIKVNGIPVSMRRVGGVWKLDVTPVNESVTQAIKAVTEHTAVVAQVVGDLEAGRIKSPDKFKELLIEADRAGVYIQGLHYVPEVIPGR